MSGGGSQASECYKDPQIIPMCKKVWEPFYQSIFILIKKKKNFFDEHKNIY